MPASSRTSLSASSDDDPADGPEAVPAPGRAPARAGASESLELDVAILMAETNTEEEPPPEDAGPVGKR